MDNKRIRQLVIALLLVLLALGLLSLVSTVFQLLIPLAILAGGAFAFYKIVLEGRDASEAMTDEMAETSGLSADESATDQGSLDQTAEGEAEEAEARQRLSAVEQARSDFLEASSPAEEILQQIKSRKQDLTGEDEA